MLRSICFALTTCTVVASLASCGGEQSTAPPAEGVTQSATMQTTPPSSTTAKADVIQTAIDAGQFKTLVSAIKAADLESTLHGPGPFTVFAPTDAAFAKLPAGTLDSLLEPQNKEKLKSILTYHVVPTKVTANEAMQTSSVKTVNGEPLQLASQASGGLMVNSASVTKPDIAASNGVIHVVDTVLMPPE